MKTKNDSMIYRETCQYPTNILRCWYKHKSFRPTLTLGDVDDNSIWWNTKSLRWFIPNKMSKVEPTGILECFI